MNRSAETLLKLFLAFPEEELFPKNMEIPLYSAGGELQGRISESKLAGLVSAGIVVRIIRHKKGHINRAILRPRASDGAVLNLSSLSGTKYSYQECLDSGCRAWVHMDLGRLLEHKGIGFREPVHTA